MAKGTDAEVVQMSDYNCSSNTWNVLLASLFDENKEKYWEEHNLMPAVLCAFLVLSAWSQIL